MTDDKEARKRKWEFVLAMTNPIVVRMIYPINFRPWNRNSSWFKRKLSFRAKKEGVGGHVLLFSIFFLFFPFFAIPWEKHHCMSTADTWFLPWNLFALKIVSFASSFFIFSLEYGNFRVGESNDIVDRPEMVFSQGAGSRKWIASDTIKWSCSR